MIDVDEEVRRAYKEKNSINVSKSYDIRIGNIIINNTELVNGTFKLEQKLCSGDSIRYGECNSAMVEFQCAADTVGNIKGMSMEIWQDVKVKRFLTETAYVNKIGKYIIDSCEITENRKFRKIVAYDTISLFRKNVAEWYSALTFPISVNDMYESLCVYLEIDYNEPNLVNGNLLIEKTIDADEILGITVLKSIAEINGGFFRANEWGVIDFITLNNTIVEELSLSNYSELKKEDFATSLIDRLNIRLETGDIGVTSGEGDNAYIIEDNFLLYGKKAEELQPIADNIYLKISNIQYIPYSATQMGLPYLQPGDYVRYITTTGSFESVILSRTLTGTQILKDKIETKGTEKTEETFGIAKEIIKLKEKSNVLVRTIEGTREAITNIENNIEENYITKNETMLEIKKSALGITSTVEANYSKKEDIEELEDKVDTLNSGGANLIDGTNEDIIVLGGYPESGVNDGISYRANKILSENEYVISFDAKSTVSGDVIKCFFYDPDTTTSGISSTGQTSKSNDGNINVTLSDKWQRYWIKYTHAPVATSTRKKAVLVGRRMAGEGTGEVSIRGVKLSEGNIAGSWQPSVNDVQNVATNLIYREAIEKENAGDIIDTSNYIKSGTIIINRKTNGHGGFKYDTKAMYKASSNYVLSFYFTKTSGTINNMYIHNGKNFIFESFKVDDVEYGTLFKVVNTECATVLNDGNTHYVVIKYKTGNSITADGGIYHTFLQPNKNDTTAYVVEYAKFKLEKGNKATEWSQNPSDIGKEIETTKTIAQQTADKFLWIVKSGTSESNFEITDRLILLTSEALDIDAITTFMNSAKDGSATVINGSSVSSGEIISINYVIDGATLIPISGCKINLEDGSFSAPNLSWDSEGRLIAKNVNITGKVIAETGGKIGVWEINSYGGLKADKKVGGGEITNRMYIQPFTDENYADTWVISSQYIQGTGTIYPYWYIKGNGDIYTEGDADIAYGRLNIRSTAYPHIGGNGGILQLSHANDTTTLGLILQAGTIRPCGNGTQTLGTSGYRWGQIYSTNSAISTSDAREKDNIKDIDEERNREFIMKIRPVSYKFINGTSDRTHYGMTAQSIEEVLKELGMTSKDFAGFIKSPKTKQVEYERIDENGKSIKDFKEEIIEGEYVYGLRYEEFIAPIISFVQAQQNQLDNLQNEIKELKQIVNNLIKQ